MTKWAEDEEKNVYEDDGYRRRVDYEAKQRPDPLNWSHWEPLLCLVYLICVVNDLQTRADHLHQVQQEQRNSINLQQRQRAAKCKTQPC